MTVQAFKNEMKALPEDFTPGPKDVICARGQSAQKHAGNQRFRVIVRSHLAKYSVSKTKVEKSIIVSSIVDIIRESSPNGGFVKMEGGRWYEGGDHFAREKVGQALRDLLHRSYSSSTKAKKLRRRQAQAMLSDEVDELLLRSNCGDISARIKELCAGARTDENVQVAFNKANMELLSTFKQRELIQPTEVVSLHEIRL